VKDTLLVPARYCGPATSGNGGYVSGALAHELGDTLGRAVTVTLRQPPPLDSTMHVNPVEEGLTLTFGGAVVAQAQFGEHDIEPVEAVSWDEALAASPSYPGHRSHPFPQCFSCGTEREDGMRIFPGIVPPVRGDSTRLAAPWIPDGTLAADYHEYDDPAPRACLAATWSALDCVGGWAGDLDERLMVLARMTVRLDSLPVIDEEHVLVGLGRGNDGRKTWTSSTMYDADGRVVASAEHLWIAVDPAAFD
jgi:hypothetical protein